MNSPSASALGEVSWPRSQGPVPGQMGGIRSRDALSPGGATVFRSPTGKFRFAGGTIQRNGALLMRGAALAVKLRRPSTTSATSFWPEHRGAGSLTNSIHLKSSSWASVSRGYRGMLIFRGWVEAIRSSIVASSPARHASRRPMYWPIHESTGAGRGVERAGHARAELPRRTWNLPAVAIGPCGHALSRRASASREASSTRQCSASRR